jgi:hypothetical protein
MALLALRGQSRSFDVVKRTHYLNLECSRSKVPIFDNLQPVISSAVPHSTCYQAGVAYNTARQIDPGQVPAHSPEQCRLVCQQHAACRFWTYQVTTDGNNQCYLLPAADTNGSPPSLILSLPHSFAGARDCNADVSDTALGAIGFNPDCYEFGVDYPGYDIYQIIARTPQQCHEFCIAHPLCKIWTLTIDAGTRAMCWLKRDGATKSLKATAMSGRKGNCRMSKG